jgi:hypothetical protein
MKYVIKRIFKGTLREEKLPESFSSMAVAEAFAIDLAEREARLVLYSSLTTEDGSEILSEPLAMVQQL